MRAHVPSGLIGVFEDAAKLVRLPENDFSWSSWSDEKAALHEIDGLLVQLRAGNIPPISAMTIIFAPTGPLQELSLSSGWAGTFLKLAERFDHEIGSFQ